MTILHSTKSELRFCAGSNPACGVSEIRYDEDLWQFFWVVVVRLNAFYRSTIPQQKMIHVRYLWFILPNQNVHPSQNINCFKLLAKNLVTDIAWAKIWLGFMQFMASYLLWTKFECVICKFEDKLLQLLSIMALLSSYLRKDLIQ